MDHITAAQNAVLRRYGPAYSHIATCAAVAARTATVDEFLAHETRLAVKLREALHQIAVTGGADITGPLQIVKDVVKELEG